MRLGVEPGDRVAIYMPMCPEVAVASHACAHVGAVQVPDLLRLRGARRRPAAPGLRGEGRAHGGLVAAARRSGSTCGRRWTRPCATPRRSSTSSRGRGTRAGARSSTESPGELAPLEVDAEHPYLLTYTSGTTGRPKGVLHVQGGFLVSIAREVAYQADAHPEDVIHFATDMGWIMGPWTVVGGGALGLHARLRRGSARPAAPTASGSSSSRNGSSVLGRLADAHPRAASRTATRRRISRRFARSSRPGEPWNPDPYRLALRAGRRRPLPDHQLLGRDRGGRLLPLAHAGDPDQGVLARRARARHGDGRRGSRGKLARGDGRGGRAGLPEAASRG